MPVECSWLLKLADNNPRRYCDRYFFFSSRRRHTRLQGDWSSDVCSSDLAERADRLQRAMQMRPGLGMHGDMVAAGFGERFEIGVAGRDHQMRVKDLFGMQIGRASCRERV